MLMRTIQKKDKRKLESSKSKRSSSRSPQNAQQAIEQYLSSIIKSA